MSGIPRAMPLEPRVLLYSLHFTVSRQCCLTLPMLSRGQTGTFVAVYGTVGLDTPISSYALDGTTSIYAADRVEQPVYGQLFYNSPTLDDGEHTLLVTNMGSGALWIDYVVYAPSVSSSSILTSRTVTPTPSQTAGVGAPTSGTGLPGSNSKSSIPIPAVVGGAVGALILIIALIFGVLYYRRRAKRVAGARLLGKENILDGKTISQMSPHVRISNPIRVSQISWRLASPSPVLSSRPLRGHILPAPMLHPVMEAPI